MGFDTLSDRQKCYEDASNYKLPRRIPVLIRVDGANFTRLCRNLQKPYEPIIIDAMAKTMISCISDMSGATFAYTQSDEITFVLRNDQTLDSDPWHDNKIQEISSITASMVTEAFNDIVRNIEPKLPLIGKACFKANCWVMPSIGEVVNNIIGRQQDCIRNSVSNTAQVLLTEKFGKKTALNMLRSYYDDSTDSKNIISSKRKIEMMLEHCEISYDDDFPSSFRLGVGVYKIPTLTDNEGSTTMRNKWRLDWDLPVFSSEGKDFLHNLITTGHDVFREEFIK